MVHKCPNAEYTYMIKKYLFRPDFVLVDLQNLQKVENFFF